MDNEIVFQTPQSIKFNGDLYLDETNNFRKLYLTETGGNNQFENLSFVLGGIGCIKKQSVNYEDLLKVIGLKNIKEFKFKTISDDADFCINLKSVKLNNLLNWINDNKNFVINLFSMNYAFYLIVDIIDEAMEQYNNYGMYMMMHLPLKNALFNSIKPYFSEFISLLYRYEYPNVHQEKIREFSTCVMSFVEQLQVENKLKVEDDFSAEFLRQIIKSMRNKNAFVFLTDNENNDIISNYSFCYSTQILKFPNAKLIFDNEDIVKPLVKSFVGGKTNYKFIDSKSEPFLQISDVIVKFFSKLISFLEKSEIDEIIYRVNHFNDIQKNNLRLFFNLENYSERICTALLQHMQPTATREKMALLENLIN